MLNSTERKANEKAEREAREKSRSRADQAAIFEGLQTLLEGDEQLLAFTRGRMAGGWRGKLTVGPEAFFAPFVNIGLTERRVLLQHIHPENGKPSEILPHSFAIADLTALTFTDIETFGAPPACRLTLRLSSEQHFRLRLEGAANCENAKAMAEVFQSLTAVQRKASRNPTHSVCPNCASMLYQPSKFCPHCGARRTDAEAETPVVFAGEPFVPPTPDFSAPEPPAPPASDFTVPEPPRPLAPDFTPSVPPVPPVPEFKAPEPPVVDAPAFSEPPAAEPPPFYSSAEGFSAEAAIDEAPHEPNPVNEIQNDAAPAPMPFPEEATSPTPFPFTASEPEQKEEPEISASGWRVVSRWPIAEPGREENAPEGDK